MSSDNIPTDEEVDGYEDYIEECIDQQHRKEEELIEKYENELHREFFRDTLIINRAHVGWTPKEEPVEEETKKHEIKSRDKINGQTILDYPDSAFTDAFKGTEYRTTSEIVEIVGCTPELARLRLDNLTKNKEDRKRKIKELFKDNGNPFKPRRWQLIE
ncbi:hypothetical protein RE474_11475 [Methanolobus sediminis]|uniref:Uncharacterized protein n=1 Tax=Methanolobus sediminis TaxID=3072978 RepID=A0AA51UKC4_9EURY|nr:hypothetical protein [Methanolobus sediminis]WMW24693.1 hypothetical protein RE474_11475 [Methanolobus sediminis]